MAQKKKHMGTERSAAVIAEVHKLLHASFIGECQYFEWISNVVLAKNPVVPGECAWTSHM